MQETRETQSWSSLDLDQAESGDFIVNSKARWKRKSPLYYKVCPWQPTKSGTGRSKASTLVLCFQAKACASNITLNPAQGLMISEPILSKCVLQSTFQAGSVENTCSLNDNSLCLSIFSFWQHVANVAMHATWKCSTKDISPIPSSTPRSFTVACFQVGSHSTHVGKENQPIILIYNVFIIYNV